MGRGHNSLAVAVAATVPARRGKAAERAHSLGLPPLTSGSAQHLIDCAGNKEWQAVADGLADYQYTSNAARRARARVLAVVAEHLTPSYQKRWDKEVGGFVQALQISDRPTGDAEKMLGPAHWPEGYAGVAERLARLNLGQSANAGHILSINFIKELCSVGYRNTYLSQIRRRGEAEGESMLARATADSPELAQRLRDLEDQAGGGKELAKSLTWEMWFDVWDAHRRAERDKREQDLPTVLLECLQRHHETTTTS